MNDFKSTVNNFMKYNFATASKQNEVSEDNSFNHFITSSINNMIDNIRTTTSSTGGEVELDIKITRSDIERYMLTLNNIVYYSKLDKDLIELFKITNLITSNWLRLIKEFGLNDKIGIDEVSFNRFIEKIVTINDTLEGNLTLRELININRLLIKRAEQVLFNVPATFRPSNSFLEAMKDAVNDTDNTCT